MAIRIHTNTELTLGPEFTAARIALSGLSEVAAGRDARGAIVNLGLCARARSDCPAGRFSTPRPVAPARSSAATVAGVTVCARRRPPRPVVPRSPPAAGTVSQY